jgi:nicotinate-nucleotide adenylyltransferase
LEKKKYKKIGILGGTFDPPHKGHLYISKIALKKLKLNKILWVITKKNPLKKNPFLDTKKRIKLSKEFVFSEKKIFVSYFDNKVRSSKTFNILNYIKKKNKRQKLYLLIGADNLVQFHKWYNWKKIPALAKIVIFARENYSMNKVRQIASKRLKRNDWIYINSKKIRISSSLIRKFW